MDKQILSDFLNSKVDKYNRLSFIEDDPISIPHNFTKKEDIEIAGFLAATLAWGNRKAILKSSRQLMTYLDNSPFDFIKNAEEIDLAHFHKFIYRTFNGIDCTYFIQSLQNIYQNHGGLSEVFKQGYSTNNSVKEAITYFRGMFFEGRYPERTGKHVANPEKGSAAKRINMYLRWMVRKDEQGVDFGLWDFIPASELLIPLDTHSSNIARNLGLLKRKQNDWKAVVELSNKLKEFDPNDPIKYDYALFGIGVNNDF